MNTQALGWVRAKSQSGTNHGTNHGTNTNAQPPKVLNESGRTPENSIGMIVEDYSVLGLNSFKRPCVRIDSILAS